MALAAKDIPATWQPAVLQALAQFLQAPEEASAEWRVKRPTTKAYKAAVDLISEISAAALPAPRIAPDRQGGIQIEWEKGAYALEISVLPDGSFEVLKVTPAREDESPASFAAVQHTIGWFARV